MVLKACVLILEDRLVLLKRKESIGCDVEVLRRKEVDAIADVKKLVVSLRSGIFGTYTSIRYRVYQSLCIVSSHLNMDVYSRVEGATAGRASCTL